MQPNHNGQASLKRPRSSSHFPTDAAAAAASGYHLGAKRPNMFKECMRYFSEQLQQIQGQFMQLYQNSPATPVGNDTDKASEVTGAPQSTLSAEDFERSLWTLLSQLRPFLFLCFPSKHTAEQGTDEDTLPLLAAALEQFGGEGAATRQTTGFAAAVAATGLTAEDVRKRFRTEDAQRDLQHVFMAHRIYTITARLTKFSPTVTLHSVMTLLSLLPKMADPFGRHADHTHRYFNTLESLLSFVRAWDGETFCALIHSLTSAAGFGVYLAVPADSRTLPLPSRRIRVLPNEAARQQLAQRMLPRDQTAAHPSNYGEQPIGNLFRSTLSPESPQEALFIAYGLWTLLAGVCREPHGILAAAGVHVSFVVAKACEVLTLQVTSHGAGSELEDQGAPANGFCPSGVPTGSGVNSPRGSHLTASPPGSPRPSSAVGCAVPYTKQEAALATVKLHNLVGSFLADLAEKGALSPDQHGPQLLSSLVNYVFATSEVSAPATWVRRLVEWLHSSVLRRPSSGAEGSWLSAAIFAVPGNLLERTLYVTCLLVSAGLDTEDRSVDTGDEAPATSAAPNAVAPAPGSDNNATGGHLKSSRVLAVDTAYMLLTLLQHAVDRHPDPRAVRTRLTLADSACGVPSQWLHTLLTRPLPSHLWLMRQLPSGAGSAVDTADCARVAPCCPSSASLTLVPTLLSLFPPATLWPLLDRTYRQTQRLQKPSAVALLSASTLCVTVRVRSVFQETAHPAFAETLRDLTVSDLRPSNVLERILQVLKEPNFLEKDLAMMVDALTRVLQVQDTSASADDATTGSAVTVLDSQEPGDPFGRELVAVTVMRAMEDYCVSHKAVYQEVSLTLWPLFYSTVTAQLPLPAPGGENGHPALNVLRRACVIPKAHLRDMMSFAARLGGIVVGCRRRLSSFLAALLRYHSGELHSSTHAARAGGARDKGDSPLSASLRLALHGLYRLVEEVALVCKSFLGVLGYAAQERSHTFLSAAPCEYLLLQMALLQRQLFRALTVLTEFKEHLGEPYGSTDGGDEEHPAPRGAPGKVSGKGATTTNTAAVASLVRTEEIVVDVDDDDDDDAACQDNVGKGANEEDSVEVSATRALTRDGSFMKKTNSDAMVAGAASTASFLGHGTGASSAHDGKDPTIDAFHFLHNSIVLVHGQMLSVIGTLFADASGSHMLSSTTETMLMRCLCGALVISPKSRDVDALLYFRVLSHRDVVLRKGYASLALFRMMTERVTPFSVIEESREMAVGMHRVPLLTWDGNAEERAPDGTSSTGETKNEATSTLLAQLHTFSSVFQHDWVSPLHGAEDKADEDLDAWRCASLMEMLFPMGQTDDGPCPALLAEGGRLLQACMSLCEAKKVPLAVRTTATELAVAILDRLEWSPEDVCRRQPSIVMSTFFVDLCARTEFDLRTVVRRSADAVLAPLYFHDGGESATDETARSRKLLEDLLSVPETEEENNSAFSPYGFSAAMAYLLYNSTSADLKFERTKALLQGTTVTMENFHRLIFKMLPSITLQLISLEADAQLKCWEHRRASLGVGCEGTGAKACPTGKQKEKQKDLGDTAITDSSCYSVFALAMQQLVSLSNSQPSEDDAREALRTPISREDSAAALVTSLFDVLDSVESLMLASKAVGGTADHGHNVCLARVSPTTSRRWLLGLTSFIRFLGDEATLVAAKLPAMLQTCAENVQLLDCVCHLWHTLVRQCKPHYLVDHAPDIVVDLVSLQREDMSEIAFGLLLRALKHLFDATQAAPFWQAYFVIVVQTNKLVRALCDLVNGEAMVRQSMSATRRRNRRPSPSAHRTRRSTEDMSSQPLQRCRESPAIAEERQEKVENVISGFLGIMTSSSAKCKAVFVRALHAFLAAADPALRLEMGNAAASRLEVVPALLRCAREISDPDDIQCAFRCVGLIGAVAPIPVDALPTNDTVARMLPPHHFSDTSARQSYYLTVPLVMDWRKLAEELLIEHCPRALANTADPKMHDYAAYAVQELLRIYTQKERRENTAALLRDEDNVSVDELARYVWWTALDTHTQNMLSGFTTTRYTTLVRHHAERQTPVYRSGMSFETWVFAFFHSLSQRCVGSYADVVKALRNVAKRDGRLLQFLLHITVAQFIVDGDDRIWHDIITEFKTICAAAATAVPGAPKDGSLSYAEPKTTPHSQQHPIRMSLRADSAMEMRTADQNVLDTRKPRSPSVDEHVQCLLHLLEDLHQLRWALCHYGHPPTSRDPSVAKNEEDLDPFPQNALALEQRFQGFLDLFPWHECAQAAIDVGSHVRALRCIERERALPPPLNAIDAVPLQRIFAALNDRDSARAIHNLSRALNPADAAFSLENTGEWQLAMQHCELILQHYPRSVNHQLTYLRCMRQLGQLHMMSRYAEKVLDEARNRAELTHQQQRQKEGLLLQTSISGQPKKAAAAPKSYLGSDVATAAPEEWSVSVLQNYANEAAWRLGEWERVSTDALLPVSLAVPVSTLMTHFLLPKSSTAGTREDSSGISTTAGSSFTAVCAATARERAKLTALIRSACREGYSQAYPYVSMLHALTDVELVAEAFTEAHRYLSREGDYDALRMEPLSLVNVTTTPERSPVAGGVEPTLLERARRELLTNVISTLNARLELVDATLEAREPILSLHRSIYRALGLPTEVSNTWISNALLLKDGNFPDAALSAAQQSNFYPSSSVCNDEFYVLTTELLHGMNRTAQAIEFAQTFAENESLPDTLRAKLQVRLTGMRKDNGSQTPKEVENAYAKAITLDPTSEEAHHNLALFYDGLYTMQSQQLESQRRSQAAATDNVAQHRIMTEYVSVIETFAFRAAEHFGLALLRGVDSVSISLPRLLTLWLDTTEILQDMRKRGFISRDHGSMRKFNNLVEGFVFHQDTQQRIPERVLMTQLPLLQSRIGHTCSDVVDVLTRIMTQLMVKFPQQTLWSVLSISFSDYNNLEGANRKKVTDRDILQRFAESSRAAKDTLTTARQLFTALIEFCRSSPDNFVRQPVARLREMPFMKEILKSLRAGKTFLVPTVNNMTPNIFTEDEADVFVGTPTLADFEDKVRVVSSMQRPKRLYVLTREGELLCYLAKAKDEPRKDIRTMEVAFLMNTIFLKNPDARRKHFSLLRYCVSPLTHDCAIIEWVSNISTLRDTANESYRLAGKGLSMEQLQMYAKQVKDNRLTRAEMLEKKVLPATPPVLHQWFDRKFPMNQEWYQARTVYTQSTALWSMVGHIVGLGDRHCENLNLGVHTGEMMHVDFAALFDHGETLQVPERVRFRLTQNLIDAMGVLGADGPFRTNCEIALRCQQVNRKAIMSIVETLIHDPLVEWQRKDKSHSSGTGAMAAKQLMDRVARRLNGYLDFYRQPPDAIALNVEGQVARLISHSSAPENLNEMYTWWMPWI